MDSLGCMLSLIPAPRLELWGNNCLVILCDVNIEFLDIIALQDTHPVQRELSLFFTFPFASDHG